MNRHLIASVLAASTLGAVGMAQAAPATYSIDPTHTFVTFEVKHFGTSTNRGRFDKKAGTVTLDKEAKSGSVDITIETGSINTGTGPFDAHLKSKDFFNAEAFPQATFKSTKFIFNGDKVSQVVGDLTLLGKTQTVVLSANNFGCYQNPMLKREVCGGDFETTIQRANFGMEYGIAYGIPNDVKLIIQVEAVKQ
ncbi:YceI family protein [Aquabacterium sp.]|uniref:YceI family protein n=1 Tax=Aquabacterium sp. TaxID=1872578 RepID=UPI0035B30199